MVRRSRTANGRSRVLIIRYNRRLHFISTSSLKYPFRIKSSKAILLSTGIPYPERKPFFGNNSSWENAQNWRKGRFGPRYLSTPFCLFLLSIGLSCISDTPKAAVLRNSSRGWAVDGSKNAPPFDLDEPELFFGGPGAGFAPDVLGNRGSGDRYQHHLGVRYVPAPLRSVEPLCRLDGNSAPRCRTGSVQKSAASVAFGRRILHVEIRRRNQAVFVSDGRLIDYVEIIDDRKSII